MSEEKKNPELNWTEMAKEWEAAGLPAEDFPKDNSEESFNAAREKIAKAKAELEAQNSATDGNKNAKEEVLGNDEKPSLEVEQKTEDKPAENTNTEEKAGEDRPTIEVVSEEEEKPEPELENDWIEEKRKFWAKYAEEIGNKFENDPAKDAESKTFSCALTQDDKKGEVKYIAPDKAQISKDSHLEMYSGLVKDAVKNNLSITFGNSLDDKQKAMLLAACLLNKEKYADGKELAMVNPPKIDLDAEYFKQLPQDVQDILKNHEAQKAEQEEIKNRLAKVKDKLNKNSEKARDAESVNERYEIRKEQIGLMRQGMTPEQVSARQEKEEEREKIMAARLGITGEYKTKNTKGEERIVKKEEGLESAKDSDGNLQISKELQDALKQKYGRSEGK